MSNVTPVQFDIYDNLADQPSEIFTTLVEKPRLCMLLNPKLTKQQVGALMRTFYIVTLKHEGKTRLAVICGFYKQSRDMDVEPQIVDLWNELAEEDAEEEE